MVCETKLCPVCHTRSGLTSDFPNSTKAEAQTSTITPPAVFTAIDCNDHNDCRICEFRRVERSLFRLHIAPEPAEGVRQYRAAMSTIMAAISEDKLVVITGKFQCGGHSLIGERPAAVEIVQI